jgi:hypothetical protein
MEIESALLALDHSRISHPSDLVREVRKRSELRGEWSDGLDAIVILVSESIGPSSSRHRFKCSNCACEAHVSFTIRDTIVRFIEAEFVHNHRLSEVTSRRAPIFLSETRDEIQYLIQGPLRDRRGKNRILSRMFNVSILTERFRMFCNSFLQSSDQLFSVWLSETCCRSLANGDDYTVNVFER